MNQAAVDGYWVVLKPLAPEVHKIYFYGTCSGDIINSAANYRISNVEILTSSNIKQQE
jgi:hypothetical protein